MKADAVSILSAMIGSGKMPQSFIDAKWIEAFLDFVPASKKRSAALWVLSLSPHYFYRNIRPEYASFSTRQFLETEFKRNRCSRQQLCDNILSSFIKPEYSVLDYGCGPGFLAESVSKIAHRVSAFDISRGVIRCAEILNPADNIRYFHPQSEKSPPAGSIDFVYSFAVVQHLTDAVFSEVLNNCYRVLRHGGTALFHVPTDSRYWKPENETPANTSLKTKLRRRYCLDCFNRSADQAANLVVNAGFAPPRIIPIRRFGVIDDGIYPDSVFLFHKP